LAPPSRNSDQQQQQQLLLQEQEYSLNVTSEPSPPRAAAMMSHEQQQQQQQQLPTSLQSAPGTEEGETVAHSLVANNVRSKSPSPPPGPPALAPPSRNSDQQQQQQQLLQEQEYSLNVTSEPSPPRAAAMMSREQQQQQQQQQHLPVPGSKSYPPPSSASLKVEHGNAAVHTLIDVGPQSALPKLDSRTGGVAPSVLDHFSRSTQQHQQQHQQHQQHQQQQQQQYASLFPSRASPSKATVAPVLLSSPVERPKVKNQTPILNCQTSNPSQVSPNGAMESYPRVDAFASKSGVRELDQQLRQDETQEEEADTAFANPSIQ
jgi:hypothetical protein